MNSALYRHYLTSHQTRRFKVFQTESKTFNYPLEQPSNPTQFYYRLPRCSLQTDVNSPQHHITCLRRCNVLSAVTHERLKALESFLAIVKVLLHRARQDENRNLHTKSYNSLLVKIARIGGDLRNENKNICWYYFEPHCCVS